MPPDELKKKIDAWQIAQRRLHYLQAMRDALPPGSTGDALIAQIQEAAAEVKRLEKLVLGEDQ